MPDIHSWIQEQLKRGYKPKGIKITLIRKNYPKEIINEVDKIAVEFNRKRYSKMLVFIVVIAAIFVLWLVNPFSSIKQSNANMIDASGKHYSDLCYQFKDTNYKISCEEAVEMALRNTPGEIQKISREPIEVDVGASSPEKQTADFWLFDIKVGEPYFDQNFRREIRYLRVGIGLDLDENLVVYQEVINS